MSKAQLFSLLTANDGKGIMLKGKKYVLMTVQREDGSGSSFNITVRDERNHVYTMYLRTND